MDKYRMYIPKSSERRINQVKQAVERMARFTIRFRFGRGAILEYKIRRKICSSGWEHGSRKTGTI